MSKLYRGDCLKVLKKIPDNYLHSLVTDPPAGISFMGKSWDDDKGGRKQWISWMTEVMQECLRVMKPGACGLVWALPRTSHWTATALEDAGFEVRDVITHHFGSGFPKSMNISIAIDKQAGAMKHRGSAFAVAGRGERKDIQDQNGKSMDAYIGITHEAKKWQGYGTALKPASEHWILIRKPISEKTVAANVLKWGVGGLNIDGCRVELNGENTSRALLQTQSWKNTSKNGVGTVTDDWQKGRFPANLILSHSDNCTEESCDMFDCPIHLMDEQSGVLEGGHNPKKGNKGIFGEAHNYTGNNFRSKPGGASRFFYCPKAPAKDKGENNTHPTVKNSKLMQYLVKLVTPKNGVVLDPFMGSGSTGVAALKDGFKFVGIEKEKEYFEISKTRIRNFRSINQ